jgi:hypothetical protein
MGIGGTYQLWGWSDGLVVPMTLEISDSLWELGAFRLARRQVAVGYGHPGQYRGRSYWGFTAMRVGSFYTARGGGCTAVSAAVIKLRPITWTRHAGISLTSWPYASTCRTARCWSLQGDLGTTPGSNSPTVARTS